MNAALEGLDVSRVHEDIRAARGLPSECYTSEDIAIAERDGELAELLMRRHIAASKRNVERHFKGALEQTPQPRGEA